MALSIRVEPGSYPLHNHGDNAMLQVAVSRLKEILPEAALAVVTSRPDRLSRHCPSVLPVDEEERRAWLSEQFVESRIGPSLLKSVRVTCEKLVINEVQPTLTVS